jgi:hypothetical protein
MHKTTKLIEQEEWTIDWLLLPTSRFDNLGKNFIDLSMAWSTSMQGFFDAGLSMEDIIANKTKPQKT